MKKLSVALFIAIFLVVFSSAVPALTVAPGCGVQWDEMDPLPGNVDGFRIKNNGTDVWEGTANLVSCDDFNPPLSEGSISLTVVTYNAVSESNASASLDFFFVENQPPTPTGVVLILAPQMP